MELLPIFLNICDLPPGTSVLQAGVFAQGAFSWPRRRGGAGISPSGPTATLRHNLRWTGGKIGDRLNHPRYRDLLTISDADFLQ